MDDAALPAHEECHEGVPVVPPLRDRSPGESYGTASRGLVPGPAMSPVNVRLADGAEVDDERTDEFSYGDGSVLAGLLQRSGSRSCT
jgi:hypothetical protein